MTETCRIGVLAESVQELGELKRLVRGAGFTVSASVDIGGPPRGFPDMDIWVVSLDLHKAESLAIVEALDAQNKYIIFDNDLLMPVAASLDEPPLLPNEIRAKRERRLAHKLRQWVEPSVPSPDERKRAHQVWVLAASTGGPEAVNTFLKEVSSDVKGVAFIYAQHIEVSALTHLYASVQRNTRWQVCDVKRTHTVREQTVYVVSPEHQIELLDNGTITPRAAAWVGQFKPSLNQVIAKVARVYGAKGGAIVFSGMGDDGANSCTMLRHRGGQVWIQALETCAVDSMPRSVNATGCVHVAASPKDLGTQFTKYQKYGVTC